MFINNYICNTTCDYIDCLFNSFTRISLNYTTSRPPAMVILVQSWRVDTRAALDRRDDRTDDPQSAGQSVNTTRHDVFV